MKLGFIILYVEDMAKTRAFYADVLGLTVTPEYSGPVFVGFRTPDSSLLALQDKASVEPPISQPLPNVGVEISFEADDVDGLYQQWKARGVEMVSEPIEMPFGRYFKAKDPEGNYLSVYRLPQRG